MLEQRGQALKECEADPRIAARQGCEPRRDRRARLFGGEQRAESDTVEGVQLARQLGDELGGDRHGAGIAVAGGDAVDDPILRQHAVHELGAALDEVAEGGIR